MSNKNVDKKKVIIDGNKGEQMVSLVKEASLFPGGQPLKTPTNFMGPLPEQGLGLKEAKLKENKASVIGTALLENSDVIALISNKKFLVNTNISADHKNANKNGLPSMAKVSFSQEVITAAINKFKLMNEQSSSNKEKPLLLTDGKELKDSELKGGELAGLDDIFDLKNKSVKNFTDEDKRKSKIREILVKAISTVNDPSAISYLSSNEFSFLSQSDNSSFLAKIIAGIDEEHAHLYGMARNVHDLRDKDKEGYKQEILRQKFVLSGLLDPKSREIIHQSISNEQLMLDFCKEANISYRSILFGFLPEKSQTIENVYEIFADCKDGNKDGNDEKFERFVKATSERYGLVWERLKKLKSEGKINLEDMIDKLEEAIENGDKLGVGVAEVLKSLIDKLDSVEEGNVPPEKTLVLLKKIWEKRRNYSLDENGLETMFSILNDLIQDGMVISDLNGVLKFISDTLNPKNLKVAFNDRAREEMFLLINNILGKNGSSLDNNTVDSMLSALADAIKTGNITGLTTKQVLELINRVIESRLNSSVMADLFKALTSIIKNDDTIDSDLVKDFFTLINNFAFKEQSIQGDSVRQSMFRTFFEFRQKSIKNKTELVLKPDVVSILNQMVAFCEERKKNLVGDDILAIVQTLESMMLLGDLSQIDLNEYLPMFTKIWEAAQVVPDSKNLSSIAQYIFGSLFLAIKDANKDNLANLKMKDVFQLYQNVLNALQGKTEAVIRSMFAGLKYALENVKNVTITQVYNLVKGSGILSDSNFQISIRTAQIIFSVLLAVLKIENRDESKVKSLFDAVNLDSIGLAFREGKIELLDKSKAKDTVSCHECINLFYTKLEEIFKEKIFELKDNNLLGHTVIDGGVNLKSQQESIKKETEKEQDVDDSQDNEEENKSTVKDRLSSSMDSIYKGNNYVSQLSKRETEEEEEDPKKEEEKIFELKDNNLLGYTRIDGGVNLKPQLESIKGVNLKPQLESIKEEAEEEQDVDDSQDNEEENKSTVKDRLSSSMDSIYKGNNYVSQLSKRETEEEEEDPKKEEEKVKDNTQEKPNKYEKIMNNYAWKIVKKKRPTFKNSQVKNDKEENINNENGANTFMHNLDDNFIVYEKVKEEQNNNQNKNEQNDVINGNINKNEEENINNSSSGNDMGSKNNGFANYNNSPGHLEMNNSANLKSQQELMEKEAEEEIKNISSKNENTRKNSQQIIFKKLDNYFKESEITTESHDVHVSKKDDNNTRITKTKNEKTSNKEAEQKNTRENSQQIIFKRLDSYFKTSKIIAKSPRVYEDCHANNRLRKKFEDPKNPQTIQKSLNKNNFIRVTWTNNFWLSLRNLFFEIIGRKDKIIVGYCISTQIDEQKNAENASVPNETVEKILLRRPIMYTECEKLSKDNKDNQDNVI